MTAPASALALGPELTIVSAAETHARLLAATAGATDTLVLDLSGVTEIDSAGVQLLVATRASLARRGLACELRAPAAAVREAVEVLGTPGLIA